MHTIVGAIHDPQFPFGRRQRDTVAGAAVPLQWTRLVALNLDAVQNFPGLEIAYFETR